MIIVDNIFQHLFILSYTFLPGEIATFHQTVSKEALSVEVMATDGIPMSLKWQFIIEYIEEYDYTLYIWANWWPIRAVPL